MTRGAGIHPHREGPRVLAENVLPALRAVLDGLDD
jgi:hypothetical protein